MIVFNLCGELFFTAEYCEDKEQTVAMLHTLLPSYKFHFTADTQSESYPNDCALNALLLGDKLFARLDSLSDSIKARAKELGITLVNTKQGYPACCALKLNDGAVISQDRGLAKTLFEKGIKVYIIDEGHIELPPHPYGFIGGAGAVFDGVLYFLGDHRLHPSCDIIEKAAKEENLSIVDICPGCILRDLGGMIFTCQDI
jgi:hypothetical protein